MIRKSLFDAVGVFDESLPACEDYDLWLRVSCRYPVFLIDEPLIVKRGGHADQLSKAAGLDKFRIKSLKQLLESGQLSGPQFQAALRTMRAKCAIFAQGCRKRGRAAEADYYEGLSLIYEDKNR